MLTPHRRRCDRIEYEWGRRTHLLNIHLYYILSLLIVN